MSVARRGVVPARVAGQPALLLELGLERVVGAAGIPAEEGGGRVVAISFRGALGEDAVLPKRIELKRFV